MTTYVPLFSCGLTLVSILLAVWGLYALHRWNRRNAALQTIYDWNRQTVEHRKAIERRFPGSIDYSFGMAPKNELTVPAGRAIYDADVDTPEWELRFNFVQLLNYCEAVSLAYLHHAVDRHIVDIALRTTLIRWHKMLEPFMTAVTQRRGSHYHPWKPYSDFVALCERETPIEQSKPLPR